jgi:hypothetical protein
MWVWTTSTGRSPVAQSGYRVRRSTASSHAAMSVRLSGSVTYIRGPLLAAAVRALARAVGATYRPTPALRHERSARRSRRQLGGIPGSGGLAGARLLRPHDLDRATRL